MQKKLGFVALLTLMIGNMVGVGIFLLPASMAEIGSISLYGWIIAATGALLLALVFSRISKLVPRAGGPYAYAHLGFGEFVGFQTVYSYWISVMAGNAATALGVAAYLRPIFPNLHSSLAITLVAISAVWIIAGINILGIRVAGIMQMLTTCIKLLPLLIILVMGWHYFNPDFVSIPINISGHSDYMAITGAALLAFWGFVGLESATVTSNVANDPRHNIPLATLLGTIITALLYISLIILITGIMPIAILQHSSSPFYDIADFIFGHWSKWVIAVWVIVACLGGLNGWRLIQSQMALAAAENHIFPRVFAKLNRFGVPAKGIMIAAMCETIILLITANTHLIHQFNVLVMLATLALFLPYLYTCLTQIFILGQVRKLSKTGWLQVIIAALATIFVFWLVLNLSKEIIYYGTIVLISSTPVYIWMRISK